MPRRQDIHKVLIIGSGPIVIGQACEFDYSGTQACKALRKLGYKVVLVNSNPATIMTDPGMADVTYVEPLTVEYLEKIIAKVRPDAVLPNLGGKTGLNLTAQLHRQGILDRYGVRIIGVQAEAIERGEDRIAFKETMDRLGIEMPRSRPAFSMQEAEEIAAELGYPVVIRPAYTLGGTGGGAGLQCGGAAHGGRPRSCCQHGWADSGGRIGAGLGRTGTGSGPRRQGPVHHRVFH